MQILRHLKEDKTCHYKEQFRFINNVITVIKTIIRITQGTQ